MSARWAAGAALTAGLVLLAAPAAHAVEPVDFEGAYVVDQVGALHGAEAQVIAALDSLWDRASLQLFVVYVDSFDSPADPAGWADETAMLNGMGVRDVLLAVALEDRLYALSTDNDIPLSDAQLDEVEIAIESALRENAWADAAIAGAEALEVAATGVVGPNVPEPAEPAPQPAPTAPAEQSGGIPILPIVGGAAVIGGGIFLYSRIRKRSKDGAVSSQPERMSQAELDRRASSLLVQLDDALKTSEQELGFAVAQFGEQAAAPFRTVLGEARRKVAEAFGLRQQLDDTQPETAQQKRDMSIRIIQLCEAAEAELDAQAEAFAQLRELEKNAPEALAALRAQAGEVGSRTDQAEGTLKTLSGSYSAAAIAPVAENVTQARELLALAEEAATDAEADIAAGEASQAAMELRTGQQALGQAASLFEAIGALQAELTAASERLDAAVADTESDIVAARALPQDETAAHLPAVISAAETALAAVRRDDPLGSIGQLETANAELEKVFTNVRDQQQRIAHARSQFDSSLSAARAELAGATDYITTRRGGIGATPRTRLAEAQRRLEAAVGLLAADPVRALEEVRQARSLAASALQAARSDVSAFQSQSSFQSSGGGGLLGGILSGGYSSGSRSSRPSWSGSGSSSRRSGGGFSSSRTSRSTGFGGGSRRSGGSRSSGRSSRGGRF